MNLDKFPSKEERLYFYKHYFQEMQGTTVEKEKCLGCLYVSVIYYVSVSPNLSYENYDKF